MIIKMDHIALSPKSISDAEKFLAALGYVKLFSEEKKKNMGIKQPLMEHFPRLHTLALFSNKNNIMIEVVDHGRITEKEGYVKPLFESTPPDFLKEKERISLYGMELFEGRTASGGWRVYSGNNSQGVFAFDKVIVETSSITSSMSFWCNFGFQKIEQGDTTYLKLKSMFHTPVSLYLKECAHTRRCLDDAGFNCIAFVSSDVRQDREDLAAKGIKTTDIEAISVNGKELNVFFAINSGGEIAEILGVKK